MEQYGLSKEETAKIKEALASEPNVENVRGVIAGTRGGRYVTFEFDVDGVQGKCEIHQASDLETFLNEG